MPCYIDAIAPQAAISSYNLLRRFDGLDIEYVNKGVCCGLPFTDMGYGNHACKIESNLAPLLKGYDAIVIPSGVCTDQIRYHFDSVEQTPEIEHIRATTFDMVEFLHDILKVKELPWAHFPHKVALHNGCHALRYLRQARPTELVEPDFSKTEDLLKLVDGIEVCYASRRDECCGFGGTFSIWDSECAGQMGLDKVNDYVENGLKYVTSADCSCLLHQSTVARRHGIDIKTFYITEILNGDARP